LGFINNSKKKKIKTKIEKLASELYELTKIVPEPLLRDIVDFLPEDVIYELAVKEDERIKDLYSEGDYIPGIARKLTYDFMETLIKVSKEIDPEYGLLKRPGKENAGELLFVRRLGIFLYSYYGSFLYEVVANTASAILDNPDIDKDTVRFALKGIDMDVVNKYEQMF